NLRSSSVSNNTTFDDGGGILDDGTVNLTFSSVSQNTALDGAGIFNSGDIHLVRSTISRNVSTSESPEPGGGIFKNSNRTAEVPPGSSVTHNIPDNCAPPGSCIGIPPG